VTGMANKTDPAVAARVPPGQPRAHPYRWSYQPMGGAVSTRPGIPQEAWSAWRSSPRDSAAGSAEK